MLASETEHQNGQRPAAFYTRPWFWTLILLLLLALFAAYYFWTEWKEQKAYEATQLALLQQKKLENSALEAEKERLLALLQEEPCTLKDILEKDSSLWPKNIPYTKENTTPLTPAPPLKDTQPLSPLQKHEPQKKTEAEAPPPLGSQNNATPAPQNNAAPATAIAASLENATVFIIAESNGNFSTGTGFFIAPGIILTNAHVVGQNPQNIYIAGKFQNGVVQATPRIISRNDKRDYAVLDVPVKDIAPLTFNTSVVRTEKISAWGFPGAISQNDPKYQALLAGKSPSVPEVVYTEGSVSVVQENKPAIIVHSAVVSQGNSGGPLVNQHGQVVGINTYISLDSESYRQSNLAIVSKDIVDFLQSNNIPFTLAKDSQE